MHSLRGSSAYLAATLGVARGSGWSRERIAAFQVQRLRALVRHAAARVPYYGALYERAALRPEAIRSLDDVERIPLTSRADLQDAAPADVIARGIEVDQLVERRSSGSSGRPFSIRRTSLEERLLHAFRLRALFARGLRLTDRRVSVQARSGTDPPGPGRPLAPFYMRLGLLERYVVDCLGELEWIRARIGELEPDILGGYPGTLACVADSLTTGDRERIHPRFMTSGGEALTPDLRRRITEGFRARVFDMYGSHEFNLIAAECPETGRLHVIEGSVLVEVLREGRPAAVGEAGELVGTALHSLAMPFIRYRLGDLVTRGETGCPCGAAGSTLLSVQGRVVDRFLLPSGRSVHAYTLGDRLIEDVPWIRQFQIVQEQRDLFRVKLVPARGAWPGPEAVGPVVALLRDRVGEPVRVEIHLVGDIPPDASGKCRAYQCRVPD